MVGQSVLVKVEQINRDGGDVEVSLDLPATTNGVEALRSYLNKIYIWLTSMIYSSYFADLEVAWEGVQRLEFGKVGRARVLKQKKNGGCILAVCKTPYLATLDSMFRLTFNEKY